MPGPLGGDRRLRNFNFPVPGFIIVELAFTPLLGCIACDHPLFRKSICTLRMSDFSEQKQLAWE